MYEDEQLRKRGGREGMEWEKIKDKEGRENMVVSMEEREGGGQAHIARLCKGRVWVRRKAEWWGIQTIKGYYAADDAILDSTDNLTACEIREGQQLYTATI